MLEQPDDEQVEDVVQLVEITNNVETTPTTAAPLSHRAAHQPMRLLWRLNPSVTVVMALMP